MLETGSRAAEFELPDLAGGTATLQEILEAGPALLAFFKVTCPTCQLTLPFLNRMAGGPSLRFVAISQDDAKSTKQFNTEFGVRFRTLLDEEDAGYQTSNAYGISYVPSMFLIEQDGRVSWTDHGFSKRSLEDLGRRAGVAPFHDDDRVPEAKSG